MIFKKLLTPLSLLTLSFFLGSAAQATNNYTCTHKNSPLYLEMAHDKSWVSVRSKATHQEEFALERQLKKNILGKTVFSKELLSESGDCMAVLKIGNKVDLKYCSDSEETVTFSCSQ